MMEPFNFFGGHKHCGIDICGFSLSHDFERSCDQRVKYLHGLELLKLNEHPSKFGGHSHCGIGDKMVLVCHVNLLDHGI